MDKVELLTRVLQADDRGLTMIFARTKRTVQRVADDLAERGFAAAAVHGDLGQGAREQALRAFRSGKVDVLVATDVAARGIDVTDVTHVINYQCPEDDKTYVHRIGRTGRAGKEGVAVTLVDWDELPRWKMISDDLGLGMPEPAETYSTSEHLFADLDIPTDATRAAAALAAHPGRAGRGVRRHRGRPGWRAQEARPVGPRPQALRRRRAAGRRGAPGPQEPGPHPEPGRGRHAGIRRRRGDRRRGRTRDRRAAARPGQRHGQRPGPGREFGVRHAASPPAPRRRPPALHRLPGRWRAAAGPGRRRQLSRNPDWHVNSCGPGRRAAPAPPACPGHRSRSVGARSGSTRSGAGAAT